MSQGRFLLGIKQQILMVTLLPSSLLVLSLAVYLVGTQFDDLDQNFSDSGQAISKQLATAAIPSLLAQNYNDLTALARQTIERYPRVRSIQIMDQFDHPIVVIGENRSSENKTIASFIAPIKPSASTIDLYPYKLDQQAQSDPGDPMQIGTIEVRLSSADHEAQKTRVMTNTFLLSTIGLLLSAALSIFLSARIAQPIEKLTSAMQRMRKGTLNVRVDEHARGEIKELQHGFNMMTREIENANENMLMQVDQATHDLQASMEVLEIKNVELDLARKRALSASRFKSEFLASMSHEIRTPMNGILGFTNLLAKTRLNETQEEYIKTIRASSNNLLAIIDDILDLSKLEVGKLTLESRPFSLRECIEDTISLLAPMAHEKKLELVSIVYNDMPDRLIGDKTRFAQIVTNLVNNAIKFTEAGEIVLRAMLEEEGENTVQMILSVCDTGSGISKEDRQAIFSAFEQGANASILGGKGTGLGLSICKRLATAMGGDITLDSTIGEGSCFSVSLHLNKDPDGSNDLFPGIDREFSGEKLLLMDKHHASRMVLRNDLLHLGLQVDDVGSYQLPDDKTWSDYEILCIGLDAASATSTSAIDEITDVLKSADLRSMLLVSASSQDILDDLAITGTTVVKTKPIKRNLLRETVAALIPSATKRSSRKSHYEDSPRDVKNAWLNGARVLVADDNAINRQLIQSILTNLGATVIPAEDGEEAIDKVLLADVDLVLMDIHMPVMDGFEATELIRRMIGPSLPVIALTADAMEKNRQEIKRIGFDGYLIKPLDDTKLLKLLAKIVRSSPENGSARKTKADKARGLVQALNRLPVRNYEKALSIAGGSKTVAQKLFTDLLDSLDEDYSMIQASWTKKDWDTLWQQLHKMQGSTAVCAVPALHKSIRDTQQAVKQENKLATAAGLTLMKREITRLHNTG